MGRVVVIVHRGVDGDAALAGVHGVGGGGGGGGFGGVRAGSCAVGGSVGGCLIGSECGSAVYLVVGAAGGA
jgi:hypothetical protein